MLKLNTIPIQLRPTHASSGVKVHLNLIAMRLLLRELVALSLYVKLAKSIPIFESITNSYANPKSGTDRATTETDATVIG